MMTWKRHLQLGIMAILLLTAPIGMRAQENQSVDEAIDSTNKILIPTANLDLDKKLQPRSIQPTIIGTAIRDDGSPAPMGTYIFSDCGGKSVKEAEVDPNGGFKFQLGAGENPLEDASDSIYSGLTDTSQSLFSDTSAFPDESLIRAVRPVGCEVRAQLAGYRSNSLRLPPFQGTELIEIGSIVLYPEAKIFGSTVSLSDQAAPKNARKAFEKGEKEYQKQNLEEATKNLQLALKDYPKFASAWFRLGQIHIEYYRVKEARDAFAKAIEADARFVSPLVELARLEAGESNWPRALELTERALDLNPLEFPDAYYIHAFACMNMKRRDDAERSARKLLPLDPQHRWPEIHMILADILHQKQDVDGEMSELQAYLKYAPGSFTRDEAIARLSDLEKAKPRQ